MNGYASIQHGAVFVSTRDFDFYDIKKGDILIKKRRLGRIGFLFSERLNKGVGCPQLKWMIPATNLHKLLYGIE